jgi:hypothetical protein
MKRNSCIDDIHVKSVRGGTEVRAWLPAAKWSRRAPFALSSIADGATTKGIPPRRRRVSMEFKASPQRPYLIFKRKQAIFNFSLRSSKCVFIHRPDNTSSHIPRRTKQVAGWGGCHVKSNSILVTPLRSARTGYGPQKCLFMESLDVGGVSIYLLLPFLPGWRSLAVCQTAKQPETAETATRRHGKHCAPLASSLIHSPFVQASLIPYRTLPT